MIHKLLVKLGVRQCDCSSVVTSTCTTYEHSRVYSTYDRESWVVHGKATTKQTRRCKTCGKTEVRYT